MTLRINKETLRNLNTDEQNQVAGGQPVTWSVDICFTDFGPRCPTNSIPKGGQYCCA